MDWIVILVPVAVVCIVLAVWFTLYFRAMQPKSGTLEWIAAYDRAPFTAFRRWERWTVRRLWPVLLCVLLSVGGRIVFLAPPFEEMEYYYYRNLVYQAIGTGTLYLIALQLDVPPLPAAFTVVAISPFFSWHSVLPVLLLSVLFLHRWATQPYNCNVFLLIAQGYLSLLLFSLVFDVETFFLLPGYLVVYCIVLVQRYRADGSILHLLRTIVLTVVALVLSLLLSFLVNHYAGYREAYPRFWDGVWAYLQFCAKNAPYFAPPYWDGILSELTRHHIVLLGGLMSLIAVWIHALRAKNFSALLLGLLTVLSIPDYLYFNISSSIFYLLLAICIAYVTGQLYRRGKRVLALVMPVALLLSECFFALTFYRLADWLDFLTLYI